MAKGKRAKASEAGTAILLPEIPEVQAGTGIFIYALAMCQQFLSRSLITWWSYHQRLDCPQHLHEFVAASNSLLVGQNCMYSLMESCERRQAVSTYQLGLVSKIL